MTKPLYLVCWILVVGAVAGCGIKKYPNTSEKNLTVRTEVQGVPFNSIDPYLHIYESTGDCKKDHLGAMKLRNGETRIGIAVGRPMCLVFVFYAKVRVHNGWLVTLRPGVQYLALVRYADRIYDISLYEAGPDGKPGRGIRREVCSCSDF